MSGDHDKDLAGLRPGTASPATMTTDEAAAELASLAEAIAMGTKNGIGLEDILAVLEDSPVATAALAGKKEILLGRSNDIGFDIRGVRKDLATALELARSSRADARTGGGALDGFSKAIEQGFGDSDVAAIVDAVTERID